MRHDFSQVDALIAFRTKLYTLVRSNDHKPADVVKATIVEICNLFQPQMKGREPSIGTVRERSGFRKERLRTLYSFPPIVRHYFRDKDQEPDSTKITVEAFKELPHGTWDAVSEIANSSAPNFFFAVVPLEEGRPALGEGTDQGVFAQRITDFLSDLKVRPKSTQAIKRVCGASAVCVIFGRPIGAEKGNGKSTPIEQFMAVYLPLRRKTTTSDVFTLARLCAPYASEMFRALTEIRQRDRAEFERLALKEIIDLVPLFASSEKPPSDAVSAMTSKFSELFSKNFPGGCEVDNNLTGGLANNEVMKRHQWVTFLTIRYKPEAESTTTPVLSVYPKAAAMRNPINSYRISRTDTLSISKYLLFHRIKSSVQLSDAFAKPLQTIAFHEEAFYPRNQTSTDAEALTALRGVVVTKNDLIWDDLHLDVAKEYVARTTAAFLLYRNQKEQDAKPFGIIAFESDDTDAFEEEDVQLIGRLVDASAMLLGHLKFGNSEVDYSSKLKTELSGTFSVRKIGNQQFPYSQIAYELLRVDLDAADEILKNGPQQLWRGTPLARSRARARLQGVLSKAKKATSTATVPLSSSGSSTERTNAAEQASLLQWLRKEDTIDLIEKEGGLAHKEFHDFLEAVPSNAVWACYFASIARALSSRRIRNKEQIHFTRFQPGYSAVAMFIVDVTNEMRQIIKMASKEKLEREFRNYQEHVRYKIPLAARIPTNGFAFDTVGSDGQPATLGGQEGYGLLVSDLIGGAVHRRHAAPKSFLELCAGFIEREHDPRFSPDCEAEEVVASIEHHFNVNTRLWIEEVRHESTDYHNEKLSDLVERLTRTGADPTAPSGTRNNKNIDERFFDYTRNLQSSPQLAPAVFEVLKRTIAYFDRNIAPTQAHALGWAKARNLRGFVKVVLKDHRMVVPGDEGFELGPDLCFVPSIVHGDLNGNNLTWAIGYKKFFIIDFENVCRGFQGADQYKVLSSLICELAASGRARRAADARKKDVAAQEAARRLEAPMRSGEHEATMSLIRLLFTWRAKIADPKISMNHIAKEVCDKHGPDNVLWFACAVLDTIDLKNVSVGYPAHINFWTVSLRNYMYRQFEYAYREMQGGHVAALNTSTLR